MKIKNIVFDLNGVLVFNSFFKLFFQLRYFDHLKFFFREKKIPNVDFFLLFLKEVKSLSSKTSYYKNKVLPPLLIDWLMGVNDSKSILEIIDNHLLHHRIPIHKKNIIKNISDIVFNPEVYSETRKIALNMLPTLLDLKEKKLIKLYILSNWDKESFKILSDQHSSFFNIFDGIMVSGSVGLVKPEEMIFKKLIKDFKLNPMQTLFVDDEEMNIIAAKKLEFQTYLFKGDFSKLKAYLYSKV